MGAEEPAHVREITDCLDAVGNTTKAATKGYAIVSAGLACFLLFTAFTDEVFLLAGQNIGGGSTVMINLFTPTVFVAGMMGGCLVFLFTSMVIRAVGETAEKMVVEVRRQFREIPGLMQGKAKPDYQACVAIVTKESLKAMIWPGLLAVCFPIAIGLIFAPCVGILEAIYLNNAGGA